MCIFFIFVIIFCIYIITISIFIIISNYKNNTHCNFWANLFYYFTNLAWPYALFQVNVTILPIRGSCLKLWCWKNSSNSHRLLAKYSNDFSQSPMKYWKRYYFPEQTYPSAFYIFHSIILFFLANIINIIFILSNDLFKDIGSLKLEISNCNQ